MLILRLRLHRINGSLSPRPKFKYPQICITYNRMRNLYVVLTVGNRSFHRSFHWWLLPIDSNLWCLRSQNPNPNLPDLKQNMWKTWLNTVKKSNISRHKMYSCEPDWIFSQIERTVAEVYQKDTGTTQWKCANGNIKNPVVKSGSVTSPCSITHDPKVCLHVTFF